MTAKRSVKPQASKRSQVRSTTLKPKKTGSVTGGFGFIKPQADVLKVSSNLGNVRRDV